VAILLFFALAGMRAASVDPRELVRESIVNGQRSWRQSFDYYCLMRDADREFDSAGRVKSTADDLFQVIPLGYGASYQEWLRHNNEPVSSAERLKQERELNKLRAETPAQKRRMFAKLANDRAYMKEVADAFDFRIIGMENLPTGPAWVLEGTPHPGYQAKSRYARMFPAMRGKLWIDQHDLQWVKADAVAADTVTFGVFIARLAKGSHIRIEQQKLADGSWVPKSIEARAQARTFLFFNHNFREEITYSDYRRSGAALAAEGRRP
jgi:hypothetical protein